MFEVNRRGLLLGATLILAAVALFAIWLTALSPFLYWPALAAGMGGWFTAWASLRPRGSLYRGLVFGLLAYLLAGIAFMLIVNARLGGTVDELLEEPLALLLSLIWPALLASYLGGYLGR